MDDLVKRIGVAMTTETNDDTSKVGTEQRKRFIQRMLAM